MKVQTLRENQARCQALQRARRCEMQRLRTDLENATRNLEALRQEHAAETTEHAQVTGALRERVAELEASLQEVQAAPNLSLLEADSDRHPPRSLWCVAVVAWVLAFVFGAISFFFCVLSCFPSHTPVGPNDGDFELDVEAEVQPSSEDSATGECC